MKMYVLRMRLITVVVTAILAVGFQRANANVANGYIIYCPCMGRFGNQAEQFLGSLQFAKHLNRTLILPPFIEYDKYQIKFTPFNEYIDADRLQEYHRVVLLEHFMSQLAAKIWKEDDRSIFCYASRDFGTSSSKKPPVEAAGCNPFEGSPFGEFWRHVGVKAFVGGSKFYGPLSTDFAFAREWTEQFSPREHPVLAFVGAPSSFPTNSKAVQLQKYVHFSSRVIEKSKRYRERLGFARVPFLSMHIRHGTDWSRACELVKSNSDLKTLFSSQQCLNSDNLHSSDHSAVVTFDLCMPSTEQLLNSIKFALEGHNTYRHPESPIRVIHIATDFDNRTLWQHIHRQLANVDSDKQLTLITPTATIHSNGTVSEHHSEPPHFMVDLHLMATANVFLGNCISSFSAFASRYRIYNLHFEQSTHFFTFDRAIKVRRFAHDEL